MVLAPGQKKTVLGLSHPYIYMLNHIIRLQAVVKITTNKTAKSLNLLGKQSTKMHTAICRNVWL
jgi:hypothetical protein